MAIKGYVVRGSYKGARVFAIESDGWSEDAPENSDEPEVFTNPAAALVAVVELETGGCTDVAIFRVLDDGREERLPSYEEALGEIERLKDRSRMVRDVDEALHAAGIEARHGEKLGERAARAAMHRCEGPCCNKPAAGVTCSEECAANLSAWLNRGDPLAALESAERRLLEAGGWVEVEVGADIWKRETEERTGSYALAIERRRLAAKGGA